MYDYLTLRPDELYLAALSPEQFNSYFDSRPAYAKKSRFRYSIEIKDYHFSIRGIQCNTLGSYAFDSDEYFKKINLIEIDIPQGAESVLDEEIRALAKAIASHFKWQIDWNE